MPLLGISMVFERLRSQFMQIIDLMVAMIGPVIFVLPKSYNVFLGPY